MSRLQVNFSFPDPVPVGEPPSVGGRRRNRMWQVDANSPVSGRGQLVQGTRKNGKFTARPVSK